MLEPTQLSSPIRRPEGAGQADAAAQAGAVLRERRHLGKILLHLGAGDDQRDAIARAGLAVPLPAPRFASTGEGLCILSVAPGAFLLITPPNGQYQLVPRLRAALSGVPAAVVDVSSHYATVRLSGPAATELLYRGCSTPLDPPDFTAGRCMTTRIGKFTAIVHFVDDAPGFDIHVPRSLAASFWRWLAEAGRDCALLVCGDGADESGADNATGSLARSEPT